jgi:hypothetical protein
MKEDLRMKRITILLISLYLGLASVTLAGEFQGGYTPPPPPPPGNGQIGAIKGLGFELVNLGIWVDSIILMVGL